jgi:uncharacterized membrane protein YtjA (UPF0391 family)
MLVLLRPFKKRTTVTLSVAKDRGRGRKADEPILFCHKGGFMLRWAIVFFVVALVAAVFGFLGIATAAVGIARILFFLFLVLFLLSLVGGLVRRA